MVRSTVVLSVIALVGSSVLTQCASAPAPSVVATAPTSAGSPAPRAVPAGSRGPAVYAMTAAALGATWRPGCPVAPENLRRVELDYIGFDRQIHRGDLVVHEELVDQVIVIFAALKRLGYPIEKMRTVDHYPSADDELSMEDNNTSAFNCRPMPHGEGWSLHAYGRAIDVNPLINPYLDNGSDLQPKTAGAYLDRQRTTPGMLHAGDPAVRAFTDHGWQWGGSWRNPVDYQHFERK